MTLKYRRNKAIPANENIAELMFNCAEDKMHIIYHTDEPNIAASTRDFVKPPNWDEKGAILTWSTEMHNTFQVE
jgi:hypothetical protein